MIPLIHNSVCSILIVIFFRKEKKAHIEVNLIIGIAQKFNILAIAVLYMTEIFPSRF